MLRLGRLALRLLEELAHQTHTRRTRCTKRGKSIAWELADTTKAKCVEGTKHKKLNAGKGQISIEEKCHGRKPSE